MVPFGDSDQGCIVIPMEWMSYTVKDLSFFWDGLDESILRDVYFQVVSGLMYLHDTKRVIHRDLKPSNLLINERGFVKIADFGVSKLVQTLDVSSTYVGTMYFMAPERLEQGAYSFSSDVWSLGLTMVATVTGRNPWAPPEEMNLFQLLGKISGDTTPSLPATGNYSAEARDFIQKCLVRDPEERLSCAELLAHPFFKGVTMESAVANVKLAVECMTRMVSLAAKKDKEVQRSQEEMAKDVQSKLDKIVK
ncbi:protein kinase [Angomonas deanei]|nr:protein kinase [Angomonas deanei]|eukprot:EPY26272.1 protein kinase [Angomonas deanei]